LKFLVLGILGILMSVAIVLLPYPMNIGVPVGAFCLATSILQPVWIVVLLLATSTLRVLWLAGGIAPQELIYSVTFLWLLGLSLLRNILRDPGTPQPGWNTPIVLPIVCMGMVGIFGAAIGILRGHSFSHWASDLNFILFFWLYFVVTASMKTQKDILRAYWPLLWITAVVVAWGFVERLMAGDVFSGIFPGFPRAMAFSSSFFVISLCLFLFAEPGSTRRRGFFFVSLFFGLHQFLSFVRVAWISQIGTIGFILISVPSEIRQRFMKWVGSFFIIVSLVCMASWIWPSQNLFVKMPTLGINRFMSIFIDVTGAGETMRTRYAEWSAAFRTYAESPFLGTGLGTEIEYIRHDYERKPLTRERYIHSSYIYYLVNTGPLGLMVFLWFCMSASRYGMQVYRKIPIAEQKGLALGLTAAFVFQLFSSIAGNELNNPARTIWTGFFLGALAVLDQSIQDKGLEG